MYHHATEMPAKTINLDDDLVIEQGATWKGRLIYYKKGDYSTYTAHGQIRDRVGGKVLAELRFEELEYGDFTVGDELLEGYTRVAPYLDYPQTAKLTPTPFDKPVVRGKNAYVYDIFLNPPGTSLTEERPRDLEGYVRVKPSVTVIP